MSPAVNDPVVLSLHLRKAARSGSRTSPQEPPEGSTCHSERPMPDTGIQSLSCDSNLALPRQPTASLLVRPTNTHKTPRSVGPKTNRSVSPPLGTPYLCG